jgi:hypothetical protein
MSNVFYKIIVAKFNKCFFMNIMNVPHEFFGVNKFLNVLTLTCVSLQ